MDTRLKPVDGRSIHRWTCFGCRRRCITGRISPFVIQVALVVIVWLVVKKTCDTSFGRDGVLTRKMRSADDENVSVFNQEEYVKGSVLRLKDIVSSSVSLDSDENQKRFYLQVDVLTRDSEQVVTLYTVGTPVILDGLMIDEINEEKEDESEKSEFYYDNSLEEKDLDEAIETGEDDLSEDISSLEKKNSGQHDLSDSGNPSGFDGHESQPAKSSDSNSLQYAGAQGSQRNQFDAMPVQNQQGQSLGDTNSINGNQMADPGQGSDTAIRQMPHGFQQSGKAIQGSNGVVNMNNQQSDNANISGQGNESPSMKVGQGVDTNEHVYTEGFQERVQNFKTEYYGRQVEGLANQLPTTYVMNNRNLCQNLDRLDVLFLIFTIPQSSEQRQRIRDTFVNTAIFPNHRIAHVFLVGQTSSPNFQANLEKEHEQYKDIVMGEFTDKLETKTTKGMMGFRWVTTFCPIAQTVMKLDEDVFVDTEKLLSGLLPAATSVMGDKAMLCFFVQNAPIPRSGPNAIDPNIFPKSSKMRPYCKGFAVLMTKRTIQSLIAASDHVPVFNYEEFYLFGALPFVAGGIEVYDLGKYRAFHDFGMAVVKCYQDLQGDCPYVVTKAFSSRFTSLWEMVSARKHPSQPPFQPNPSLWNIRNYRASFYS